ncbi:MAG: ABC transporter substrate-binding protein [Clostridia bacterium]|nr:ABC transporter substrate-binding protein [Clostridia bacterium]
MKKLISLILIAVIAVTALTACTTGTTGQKTYKVGICNYVDDASLNQIVANIKAELAATEKAKNVKIAVVEQNCNADSNVLNQIITDFEAQKVDLMIGIATPVAIAMQSATEDSKTPVVFAAVSDPLAAKLVTTLEKPGANITGTSDFLDTEAVMKLIFAQNPEAKTVGLLYDLGQDSSTTAIAAAKQFLTEKGVTIKEYTGTNTQEIGLQIDKIISDGCDAVFTPSDNTVMTAELSIYEKLADAKILHYAGADSFALNGAFCGYGVDYANLGTETAKMAAEILLDGKKPADMAVKTFDNGTATVNTDICEKVGLSYDDVAATFGPFCTKVQPIKTAESFE